MKKTRCSPCNVWETVAAGHVQWGPSLLVSLVDVCSIVDQQFHTLQVPRQDGLMNGSHACISGATKTSLAQDNACGFMSKIVSQIRVVLLFHGLTRVVDGVQVDSPGSDETPNPLQLAMSYVVLEKDVIGKVDTAERLQRSRALAADLDTTVFRASLYSHGLGHGALIVFHLPQISLCSGKKAGKFRQSDIKRIKFDFLRALKIRADSLRYMRSQLLSCRRIRQFSACLSTSCVSCVFDSGAVFESQASPWSSLYSMLGYFKM